MEKKLVFTTYPQVVHKCCEMFFTCYPPSERVFTNFDSSFSVPALDADAYRAKIHHDPERNMSQLEVTSPYSPQGDQPAAIAKLAEGLTAGKKCQTLMGVTGSGKTFTMAHVIAQAQRPTLVISHNKTLAGQLYEEFRQLFAHNAVGYFVSYYDYYQPEAYIPQRDIYIEKDASRNDDLDRLRLSATSNLVSRRDVVIVASVSCIYGLGSPEDYRASVISLAVGKTIERDEFLARLVGLQYDRNDVTFGRGLFRARGDTVEVWPSYEEFAMRVQLFGDTIEELALINPTSGEVLSRESLLFIYPAVHYVIPQERMTGALESIRSELNDRLMALKNQGKLLEAQRLAARTRYDLEMLAETGICSGIENYSRHFTGLPPGAPPTTLLDYFPDDFLVILDESHATVPQIRAMYAGDRARKEVLVEHGFRLPSALDNRPLKFEEFEKKIHQCLFISATPGPYEMERCPNDVVEQIIRPTGLIDPQVRVEPARGQVPHLLEEIKKRVAVGERTLVTSLTKRLAEDLSSYFEQSGLKCCYLHSEIDTLERLVILNDLRSGTYDVVVGVNLLREGLDLPEVSLVAILDADKEGFLRSTTSLIQTIGRSARNVNAQVILYADQITPSMQQAMDETARRRQIQEAYNVEHGITPQTIQKAIRNELESQISGRHKAAEAVRLQETQLDQTEMLADLQRQMLEAAEALEFERAAQIRDMIAELHGEEETGGKAKTGASGAAKPFNPQRTGHKGHVKGDVRLPVKKNPPGKPKWI